jgi:hypothetical protein
VVSLDYSGYGILRDIQDQPWKKLVKFHDMTDRALFFASTVITVGDGKNTPFWEARSINGVATKELAPNLYKQARFKSRTVHKEFRGTDGRVRSSFHYSE